MKSNNGVQETSWKMKPKVISQCIYMLFIFIKCIQAYLNSRLSLFKLSLTRIAEEYNKNTTFTTE